MTERLSKADYCNIDFADPASLLEHAKKLEGRTFQDVLDLGIEPKGSDSKQSYDSKKFRGGDGGDCLSLLGERVLVSAAQRRHDRAVQARRLRDGINQRGSRGCGLEVAVLLLERGDALLNRGVGLALGFLQAVCLCQAGNEQNGTRNLNSLADAPC